jgi:hypothetical protein
VICIIINPKTMLQMHEQLLSITQTESLLVLFSEKTEHLLIKEFDHFSDIYSILLENISCINIRNDL